MQRQLELLYERKKKLVAETNEEHEQLLKEQQALLRQEEQEELQRHAKFEEEFLQLSTQIRDMKAQMREWTAKEGPGEEETEKQIEIVLREKEKIHVTFNTSAMHLFDTCEGQVKICDRTDWHQQSFFQVTPFITEINYEVSYKTPVK